VVSFEVTITSTDMLNHGNIRLAGNLDGVLRWFLVTPDMHRVHHSVQDDECNSNFGFSLTWWDRLFGTYRAQARAPQDSMAIGIYGHTDPREVARLDGMLLMPFKGEIGGYAINRRQWVDSHE
jgi:sterol desaturase/sphingolipid hydroxylase (fatty acid hydroxylase superfamily)